MWDVLIPFESDVEREFRNGQEPLPKILIELAVELGVNPDERREQLQDVVDLDALAELVGERSDATDEVRVSFDVWGIRYVVTPTSVSATRER